MLFAGEPQPGSVILLATRIDAMTMFDQAEVGADSPVTNIVAMLETARLLSRQKLPFDDGEVRIHAMVLHTARMPRCNVLCM